MKKGVWLAFWILGATWGSSFMLIRIGVQEINPFELVFIRVGIAAVGLLLILRWRGIAIPTERSVLLPLIVIGIGNPAIPFLLISWGEQSIHSSVASILQSTASLFTLVIAHFFFADERLSLQRVGGMVVGFMGVIVLFSANIEGGKVLIDGILGQLAIVVASLFYATFITYSRVMLQGKRVPPLVVAAITMSSATIVMGIAMFISPLFGGPAPVWLGDVSRKSAAAAVTLGLFNTLFAYTLFYTIVSNLGAARAAMVTYVVPVVGLVLGIVFLSEPFSVYLISGAALIVGGIAVVNLPLNKLRLRRKQSEVPV